MRQREDGPVELDIDAARFRFVSVDSYVREVYYGNLFVIIQHCNDPNCYWEQQRALDGAASLLRYRWKRLSSHQRLEFLVTIEGRDIADDRGGPTRPDATRDIALEYS
jgi:hypothetical protein